VLDALTERTRGLAARLLNCQPSEIALVGPTSLALSLIAGGLRLRKGHNVLVCFEDYPSNVYPWMAMADRGVQVRFLNTRRPGMIRAVHVRTSLQEHRRRPLEGGGLHQRARLHRADLLAPLPQVPRRLEQDKAMEAALEGKKYTHILDKPYRWETWAAPKGQGRHHRPQHGPHRRRPHRLRQRQALPLPARLQAARPPARTPSNTRSARSSARSRTASRAATTCARSSTTSTSCASLQTEKHELSHLYEAKIKNMGNAGRNGGEYYTPRPLIRAIVRSSQRRRSARPSTTAPVGSAGFLCEAFDYLRAEPQAHHRAGPHPAGAHLLRQGKEVPRLRHRDHEHDPARHRGAQHPPHQHARREPRRRPGEGPLRHRPRQSALRRQRAQGGPAELPHPHRRDRLPLPPALHQDPQGRRPRRHRHQEHLPLQHRQRLRQPAAKAPRRAATSTPCSTAPAAPSRARA
jgi:hypothetical protein